MKIVQVYNQQRAMFGGEEGVIETIRRVLDRNGHTTSILMRSSRGLDKDLAGKVKMAATGVFNPSAYYEMRRFLDVERPDLVHVHSIYPNFSPSVLVACRSKHVPTVFHVHCHLLTCPNWYHLRQGKACELCFGGREHWCLLTNCRSSLPESAAYAIRSYIGRRLNLFRNNVTVFIAVSQFVRDRLVASGYPSEQIEILQNATSIGETPSSMSRTSGEYVGYAGRLSVEKGVDTLIEAARTCGLPVRVAGDGPELDRLRSVAPSNVVFLGRLARPEMRTFYQNSRFIVVPSRWYEAFCLSAAEGMMAGKPVVASRIGALPELVINGVSGLLVETDNVAQLADSMSLLWNDEQLCAKLGGAARTWAQAHCCEDVFYERLIAIYERAINMTGKPSENLRTMQRDTGALMTQS